VGEGREYLLDPDLTATTVDCRAVDAPGKRPVSRTIEVPTVGPSSGSPQSIDVNVIS
jgi:hypothetical protein